MNSLLLMTWLSPAFPVGSFAYSHGLEWAQEAGDISDATSLAAWLSDLLELGSLRADAILLSNAYGAITNHDKNLLLEVAELAAALCPSTERRLETIQQGNSFLRIAQDAWPCPALQSLRSLPISEIAYPVALGVAAAGHGIDKSQVLSAFSLAFLANLTSAAIRLGVIGQTGGQRVIASLLPKVQRVAEFAFAASLDDLGSCAFRSDMASLKHETQYTRIFRS